MNPKVYRHFLLSALLAYSFNTLAQTAQKEQRLKEIVNYAYHPYGGIVETDSIQLFYSSGRGSRFIPYNFVARTRYWRLGYGLVYMPTESELTELPDVFQDFGRKTVSYDSAHVYTDWNQPELKLSEKYYSTYSDTNLTSHEDFFTYGRYRYNITYDQHHFPNGYQLAKYDSTGMRWDTIAVRKLTIKDGKVTANITSNKHDTGLITYAYDNAGRILEVSTYSNTDTTSGKTMRDVFTYNIHGNVVNRVVLYSSDPANPNLDTQQIFTIDYDYAQRISFYRQHVRVGADLVKSTEYEYHYESKGQLDTLRMREYYTGQMVVTYTTRFYYNNYGNPDSAFSYIDRPGTVPSTHRTYFKYELYEPQRDTVTPSRYEPLVIFPNPAKNILRIRWNSQHPATAVNVYFYSGNGQLMKREYIPKLRPETWISIGGLASGIYHLSIVTESGGLLHKQSIIVNQ